MTTWLLKAIGVSGEITSKIDRVEWLWSRPMVLWIGLAALVPLGVFIVLRHRSSLPHVSPTARGLLSVCRVGVMLLLVVVLAGPYVKIQEQVTQKPVLALVLDESASMSLPAGPFDAAEMERMAKALDPGAAPPADAAAPADAEAAVADPAAELRKTLNTITRLELAERVIAARREAWLKPLEDKYDVRTYRVARTVRSAGLVLDEKTPALPAAEADETALGAGLEQAFDDAANRQVAGVVLISDGHTTIGPEPAAVLAQRGASGLPDAGQAAPIFTVPVGAAAPMPDVTLLDVLAPARVAKADTVTIIATVGSTGFDGRDVAVKLFENDQVLDETTVRLSGGQRQQVQLTFTAQEPGNRLLSLRIDEQAEEQVKANNQEVVEIKVDADKQRVLFIEGYPRWDFRFLDHAFRRDNGLEVTQVMQAQLEGAGVLPGDMVQVAKLPEDAAGWAEFNLVILGDVSPTLLTERVQEQLVRAVEEEGVGLLVQAGPRFMPAAYAGAPLERLLPVKFAAMTDADLERGQTGLEAPAYAPFRMKVTAPGSIHPAFQLYDSATKNRRIWSRMPEFYWCAAATEPGPGATVLAELDSTSDPRPLIVEQFVGKGRVVFIGIDSTYRWRRNIGSHLFYRFWGQGIRHAAKNKDRGTDKSWLEVYPTRVEPDDPVSIELYAVDDEGQAIAHPQVTLQIAGGDAMDSQTLDRHEQAGHYRGVWKPRQAGQYRLSYTDAGGKTVSAAVRVSGSGEELRRPVVDRDALGSLADASGGTLLELDQLDQLAGRLKAEATTVDRSHEEEIWDNWLTLVLLVGLYCTDVGVRRMMGLT